MTHSRGGLDLENDGKPIVLRDVRVLLVDHDPDSAMLVRRILEGAGARVTVASSADEALTAGIDFDVIVSDISAQQMDGFALLRCVRSRDEGGRIPAIALAGDLGPEISACAFSAGYQEIIVKPFEDSTLVSALQSWAATTPRVQ